MTFSSNRNGIAASPGGPPWAAWLGVVTIVLGVFLAAVHGNEWMAQHVLSDYMPQGDMPPADCPEEELEEEGLTLEECEYLVTHVRGLDASTPDWFPRVYMMLAAAGTLFAFCSIIVGGALVDYRSWAPAAAVAVFGLLAAVDILQFVAVVNTGPIIRQFYLAEILLWFLLHVLMATGAVAGRRIEAEAPATP